MTPIATRWFRPVPTWVGHVSDGNHPWRVWTSSTDPIIGDSRNETVGGVEMAVQEDDSTGENVCSMSWRSNVLAAPPPRVRP